MCEVDGAIKCKFANRISSFSRLQPISHRQRYDVLFNIFRIRALSHMAISRKSRCFDYLELRETATA